MSNPTEKESELERVEFAFRKVIYEISSAIIEGEIGKNAKNRYSLLLSIKDLVLTNKGDFEIFIKPISLQGDHFQNVLLTDRQDFKFSGFEEYQLSPFICFLVRHTGLQLEKQFIIEIDLDLGENRKKAILKHILGNQDKLFKFLMFLLAKDQIEPILTFGELSQEEIAKALSSAHKPATQYPMYEKLLYAASRNKESLASVISIVESLYGEFDETQQELVSENFYELIKVFKDIDL